MENKPLAELEKETSDMCCNVKKAIAAKGFTDEQFDRALCEEIQLVCARLKKRFGVD